MNHNVMSALFLVWSLSCCSCVFPRILQDLHTAIQRLYGLTMLPLFRAQFQHFIITAAGSKMK